MDNLFYKEKYLEFKSKGVMKRMTAETRILNDNNYSIESKDNLLYECTNNNTGAKYIIQLPPDYPFKSPIINGKKSPYIWSPGNKLFQFIHELENKYQVLIYCHYELANDHFLFNEFKQVLNDKGVDIDNALLHTLDIRNDGIINSNNIVADGFSDEFIYSNENFFDLVFVPDCAGLWYDYQREDTPENYENLKQLMLKILIIVKNGHDVFFSKFLQREWVQRLVDELSTVPVVESVSTTRLGSIDNWIILTKK